MRLEIATAVATLSAMCAADALMVYSQCWPSGDGGACDNHYAVWYTAYGGIVVDATDGCRAQGGGMVEFCIDCTLQPRITHPIPR